MELFVAFMAILALFPVLLFFKKITSFRFCVLCASVSLTWLGLLFLYWVGRFDDTVVLALLIGQSIVGVYYVAEKRLANKFMVFRLAGLLTMTFVAYVLLSGFDATVFVLLAAAWLLSGILYSYRNSSRLKTTVDHIVACCRDL